MYTLGVLSGVGLMMIVCELQCRDYEHVPFNTAIIEALSTASQEKLMFFAEEGHLGYVRESIDGKFASKIEWVGLPVASRYSKTYQRAFLELYAMLKLTKTARQHSRGVLFFTSINSSSLYLLKILMRCFPGFRAIVVPHSILETITKSPRNLLKRLMWFSNAIKWKNTDKIKYMLLNPCIQDNLLKYLPQIKENCVSIYHPYQFSDTTDYRPFTGGKVKFGSLGVVSRKKGSHLFAQLSKDIEEHGLKNTEFRFVGHIPQREEFGNLLNETWLQMGASYSPLNRADYEHSVKQLDYTIFCYDSDQYNLTVSGACLDAISFQKPIITLRNSVFEHYFKEFGDIGYICDNFSELKQIVREIVVSQPSDRYYKQVDNIKKMQQHMRITAVSKTIKRLLG